uniref:Protein kinase-like domain, concanavalin A-like lectin/glucanase domain protein n=1 Tax=Tanacetum cinerariifolium TaxID=118510 RepID=A0A6L2M1Q0_TANCI|nr:protein kinase-like domain, concanavalin A-like lectin/glucanase domain protein [Tanacetum cinerariifolium]
MEVPEQTYFDYASLCTNEMGGKRLTSNQGLRNFNDVTDAWKEKPSFNWGRTHTFTNPQNESISVYSSSYQLKLEKDDIIGKINLFWKTVSEKLNDTYSPENAGNSMSPKSIATISHDEWEEIRKKGIKSPSKLLSLKYLSLYRKKEEGVKEQANEENEMETDMEVDEVIKEESEFKTDEEVEEILKEEEDDRDSENFNLFPTMKGLTHHEWLLKNPRPLWVKARIRFGSPNNIKISCMIGHHFMRHAYIDLESPINIMSRRQYNQIMTYGPRSRQKPSNPNKIRNFMGRIRGLNIFIGSFTYECEFMILEDTASIIDHHLREMVFERPYIGETGLVYNKKEGTVIFKQGEEKIMFKIPHTMKMFKQTRLMGLSTDFIPLSAYEENFGHRKKHYYQSLLIGDEYKHDEGNRRGIRHLIRLEKEMIDNKEVT